MPEALTLAADDWSLTLLRNRLGDRLEVEPKSTLRVTFLDTFDWRLFNRGCRLTSERQDARTSLHWCSPNRPHPYVLPVDRDIHFARDLPGGFLRSELVEVSGVRALLPIGAARVSRQYARVLDAEGNTVARLLVEDSTPLDCSKKIPGNPMRTVTVQPVGTARRAHDRLLRLLRDSGATDPPRIDVAAAAAEIRGRLPGDYSSKLQFTLRPDQRCDEVLRTILDSLRKTVAANVEGVLDDVDVEFLHDLRVACRRARSALSQIKGALRQPDADNLATEIRWLCEVTNSCRDLDVYLLEMDGYRRQLEPAANEIDGFDKLLRRERAKALRRVRGALRSKKFDGLMAEWSLLVAPDNSEMEAPHAAPPVGEIAGKKILKAYRKMVKRGARLSDPPPAEDLHRLRIDAKKLRYLLEFFGGLYARKTIARLVKELKLFQDILGGSNDMAVQQRHLAVFAETLMAEGSTRAGTVFAMGRLADMMADRQEVYVTAFAERFQLFAGDTSRRLYNKTFGEG